MRPRTTLSLFLAAIVCAPVVTLAQPRPFYEPDAAVLQLTAADLGRIAGSALLPDGGHRLAGRRARVSSEVSDLRYSAQLSDVRLALAEGGKAVLNVEILQGNLRVGRIERRFLRRSASCDELGVDIEGERPVDLSLALRFVVEGGDLRIVPEGLDLAHLEDNLQLVKPARCRNTVLPRWVVWQLGRPQLRKRLAHLDDVLLAKAVEGASQLNDAGGLLRAEWSGLELEPRALDTASGSLLVAFSASRGEPLDPDSGPPRWGGPRPAGSFLALSESLLSAILQRAAEPLENRELRPRGSLRRLFQNEAILALAPGLRGIERPEDLFVTFAFAVPPRIEIGEARAPQEGDATLRLLVERAQLRLWERGDGGDAPPRSLGSLEVASASVEVRPYFNPLGGISFELVNNDWKVTSSGIAFDDPLLAATLQELAFGHVFATRHEPLGRGAFRVGQTALAPRSFSRSGHYLVIGFEGDQANK